jgi:hypothetical protein
MARRHRPLEVTIDGRRECSVDGLLVVGFGETLRHEGEAVPVVVPDPEDARVMTRAREVALAVARRMPGATDEQIVQAIADAFYIEGLFRRRPGEIRRNAVLADPEPRDADHAERAAGMTAEVVSAA